MSKEQKTYQVLSRKYRPQKLSELVGQDVLIQTLTNEIKNSKVPHAYILTGIRGIGKTTTARIIAKALNCVGENGQGIETTEPCGICQHCLSIANSNNQDVIEFDAASHTGVGDIRDIIETINYAPVSARYKIYIIDEVHMLSNSAFNALLKTLEEPPAHVKFIFATTEINKVPITILSRCQRFDLRRLNFNEVKQHLKSVGDQEGYEIEDGALSLLSSASEGSARDALSLLDRAFAHNNHQKILTEKIVFDMLGLAGKNEIYDLFENLLSGNIEEALNKFNDIYSVSVDIKTILQDLSEVNHNITLAKTIKNFSKNSHLPNDQIKRIQDTAEKVSLGSLTKIWQMLLRGVNDLRTASNQKDAMEMLLIKICYGSKLPELEQIINKLNNCNDIENDKKSSLAENVLNNFKGANLIDKQNN
jgi:DNA polymerase III subunit gamma/tau